MKKDSRKVLVLGGGFGGLSFVKAFKSKDTMTTLLDRQNHHLFQPLLYQVATAGLSAPEIAQPLRSIFSKRKDVEVLMQAVQSVDLESRKVKTEGGDFPYDYLVMALGSRTNYFGNDEWAKHAYGLKSLGDAHRIRNRVLRAFERAEDGIKDPEELERLLTFAVIGGGPTGLEMAGSLAELCKCILRRDFKRIDPSRARIFLIEAAPRLLWFYPEKLSAQAQRQLEELGVTVITNDPVEDIREMEVILKSTTLRAGTIIWTAGVSANPVADTLDAPKDKAGRIKVEPDCSIPGHPEAFVIGDMAHLVDTKGTPVPGLAPAAMQMAKHVAKIIKKEVTGRTRKNRPAFTYIDKGSMATIGRSRAVAEFHGKGFSGWFAWLLWLVVHLVLLVGLRNKLAVLLQWFYHYVRYRPGARIIWRSDHDETSDPLAKTKR